MTLTQKRISLKGRSMLKQEHREVMYWMLSEILEVRASGLNSAASWEINGISSAVQTGYVQVY